jgi:hypothetical protein
MVWTVDPKVICREREDYARWHDGLERLIKILIDGIPGFQINGLAAPPRPWEAIAVESD